jgi:hypothetical protein
MLKPIATMSDKDIRQMKRQLTQIQPGLRQVFVNDIKSIGKEAESPIKAGIRQIKPLSGMQDHYGQTSWNHGAKPADSTTVRSRLTAGGRSLTTSLLSVRINSAAVSIADMAGRSGRSVGQGKRNSGVTPVIRRTASGDLVAYARRTPADAGKKFIANLNAVTGVLKRSASRIAWPSVERDLPQFERRIDKVIATYYQVANRKFD